MATVKTAANKRKSANTKKKAPRISKDSATNRAIPGGIAHAEAAVEQAIDSWLKATVQANNQAEREVQKLSKRYDHLLERSKALRAKIPKSEAGRKRALDAYAKTREQRVLVRQQLEEAKRRKKEAGINAVRASRMQSHFENLKDYRKRS